MARENRIFVEGKTLVILLVQLTQFIGVHEFYEKRQLKGPLKGINMPANIFLEYYKDRDMDEITILLHNLIQEHSVSYLIFSLCGDNSSLLHEYAHAVYYLQEDYRLVVEGIWDELDAAIRKHIEKELQLRNYDPSVYLDEFQAYLLESSLDFGRKWSRQLHPFHKKLRGLVTMPTLKHRVA